MVREMRGQDYTWDAIAALLGVYKQTVISHAILHLGLTRESVAVKVAREKHEKQDRYLDRDEYPLPAGHPVTWGAIVAGTCLEGKPYPIKGFTSANE